MEQSNSVNTLEIERKYASNDTMSETTTRILIIDDEPSILITFQLALIKHGYRVDTEQSGLKALERMANEDFHAIIIDFQLSDIEGTDFIHRLRLRNNNTPVLIASSSLPPSGQICKLREKNVAYVQTPFEPETLRSALHGLLKAS